MRGLSFLETSNDPNVAAKSEGGNTGFFRQNARDAAQAKRAGLPDPRTGTYEQQESANWAYIQKFFPKAAEAIKRGDYDAASQMLHGHWVGLPGGSQPQSAKRMAEWRKTLAPDKDGAADQRTAIHKDFGKGFTHRMQAALQAAKTTATNPGTPEEMGGFAADVTAMTLAGGSPQNIHDYMAKHGINMSVATCGQFMAAMVKRHGGEPPQGFETASNWRGWGEGGYAGGPGMANIAVRNTGKTGQPGSHVTAAVPVYDDKGNITAWQGIGANQFNPKGAQHGIGQYGHDVVSNRPITIGSGPRQYQIRHMLLGPDQEAPTARVDGAVNTGAAGASNVQGSVNVTVNSNGTAAKTNASSHGKLWQNTTIQSYKQMQLTDRPGIGFGPT
jgi:hypothetical protein